jgi:predicted GNAT family acetyltransferase
LHRRWSLRAVWRDRPPHQPQSRLTLADAPLLQALEAYYDAIPREAARVEQIAEVAQRATTTPRDLAADAFDREQRRSGRLQTALALVDGQPVGVGSHLPLGEVAEIAGVGVLPAFRRRGLGAALTAYLAGDARARGIRIVFLTAGDPDIARVYARVGFETLAVAGTAEPARRD